MADGPNAAVKCIEVLGAPIDLGADRRGVDMGPSAIRYAGLLQSLQDCGHNVVDLGNLPLLLAGGSDIGSHKAKYLDQIIEVAHAINHRVAEVISRGHIPLVLGGDHSVGLGSVSGASHQRQTGLLWLDAHGDFNTLDTSPSGNVHGMVLAALAGYGDPRMTAMGNRVPVVDPRNIAIVGVRELDVGEQRLLTEAQVNVFTISDIDRRGLGSVMEDALDCVSQAEGGIHLSLDLDIVDPATAPGVGTPVTGGLSYRETQLTMEMVAASGGLQSMDIVEVNPILDSHNQTAALAVDLVLSALGKRIL